MSNPDILEFSPGDVEILEEFVFDEEDVQRREEFKYFPLQQQLDDLVQSMLPVSESISPYLISKALHKRTLAEKLYRETTAFDSQGAPKAKSFTKTPLEDETLLPWMIPIVDGIEILRDVDVEPTDSFRVVQTGQPESKTMTRDQQLYEKLDQLKPILQKGTSETLTPATTTRVLYDGFVPAKGKKSVDPKRKETKLLSSSVSHRIIQQSNGTIETIDRVNYPAEQVGISGWVLLPQKHNDGITGLKDAIEDPPSSQLWFQDKPVVINEYKDIFANAPTLQELIQSADGDKTKLLATLKHWNLSVKDIPWSEYTQLFPDEPVPEKTDPLKFDLNLKTGDLTVPTVYGQYQKGSTIHGWVFGKPDQGQWMRLTRLENALKELNPSSIEVPVDIKTPELEKTTIGDCMIAKSYSEFQRTGVFQSESKTCVPVNVLRRNEVLRRAQNRIELAEFKKQLNELISMFEFVLSSGEVKVIRKPKAKEARSVETLSEKRKKILSILENVELGDVDKKTMILDWLASWEAINLNNQYSTESDFIICQHTLDSLGMEGITTEFRETYLLENEGFEYCKFCGETYGRSEYDMQDEYDENGRLNISHSVLGSQAVQKTSEKIGTYLDTIAGILEPKTRQDGKLLFMLISMLGIEPEEKFLLDFTKIAFAGTDQTLKNVPPAQQLFYQGIFGVAWFIVLLKTHTPVLRPTRLFPKFAFTLEGFPRSLKDTDTSSPILDYILNLLSFTYKQTSFANARRDKRDPVLSKLIDNRSDFKTAVLTILRRILSFLPIETIFNEPSSLPPQDAIGFSIVSSLNAAMTLDDIGAWIWGRSIDSVANDLTKTQNVYDRLGEAYESALKKAISYISKEAKTFARSPELILEDPYHIDSALIQQTVVNPIQTKPIEKKKKRQSLFSDILYATTEKELEKGVQKLIKDTPKTKYRITLERKDLESNERTILETKLIEVCIRNLARVFIGKSKHKYYNPIDDIREGSSRLAEAYLKREKVIDTIPTLTVKDKTYYTTMNDVLLSLDELDSEIDQTLRLNIVQAMLQIVMKETTEEFGQELVKKTFESIVDYSSLIYKYSSSEISSRLEKLKTNERKAFRTRLGLQSDEERVITVELMQSGLLATSVVVDYSDRAEFAEMLDKEPDMEALVSITTDQDIPEQLEDRGEYGLYMDNDDDWDDWMPNSWTD